jgi:hypothetical protein
VFVILQPYKKLFLKKQGKKKLAPEFCGPFQINKNISKVAYGLELLENCHIHNIFHVSCLKKVFGKAQPVQIEMFEFDDEGIIILEAEGMFSTKDKVLHSKTIKKYLIKWKNL